MRLIHEACIRHLCCNNLSGLTFQRAASKHICSMFAPTTVNTDMNNNTNLNNLGYTLTHIIIHGAQSMYTQLLFWINLFSLLAVVL